MGPAGNTRPYPRKIAYLTLNAITNDIRTPTRVWNEIAHRHFTPTGSAAGDALPTYTQWRSRRQLRGKRVVPQPRAVPPAISAAETADANARPRARRDPRPEAAASVARESRPRGGYRLRGDYRLQWPRSRQAVDRQDRAADQRCPPANRPHQGPEHNNWNLAAGIRRRRASRPSLAKGFGRLGWRRPMAPQARTCRRA